MSITAVSIANPRALNESELRNELELANAQLLRQAQCIADLQIQTNSLGAAVSNLCELQLAGRLADVNAELERMAQVYKKIQAAMVARRVH